MSSAISSIRICTLVIVAALLVTATACAATNVWKTSFTLPEGSNAGPAPNGWALKGTSWGIPDSTFSVVRDADGTPVLHLVSERARGGLMRTAEGVDLNKAPVMRWKWRALVLAPGADGRIADKADQPIEVFVISGGLMSQKCVSYSWQTETPRGASLRYSVFMGAFEDTWHCIRNKEDGTNVWYVEERNVAKDFKDAYGFIPDEVAVMAFCKSDKTRTRTEADLAWIAFSLGE
ncbi:DUF3047 domain-containing protein [bacterium]|nr:DUF3047 domain-containing protein [bacterium]